MVKENEGLISDQGQINRKKYVDQAKDPDLAEDYEILVNQDENDADRRDQILEDQG